jgi:N-methylhydantoinase B
LSASSGTASRPDLDPATIEIVHHALIALAGEMMVNVKRAAYSPSIHEIQDVAVGLLDAKGNLLACAPGLPMFLADLGECVRDGLELIGRAAMKPGDVFLSNDPFTIGTHINNVATYLPIFWEEELVAFAAVRGHMVDMGGAVPGSRSGSLTEIYQEGLRLRQVRFYDGGRPVADLHRVIADNSRMPEAVLGDLRAQVAACHTGERRFRDLLGKYGVEALAACAEEVMNHGERLARVALERIPDGEYRAESFLDDDGIDRGKEIRLPITVRIEGTQMTVDFSEYPEQVRGSINTGRSGAVAIARTALKSLTTPTEPPNEGQFRPLDVVVPDGKVVSAEPPAACGWWARMTSTSIDTILLALAPAMPERIPAAHFGDVPMMLIDGRDRAGQRFVIFDPVPGGHGGRPHEDGPSAVVAFHEGDTPDIPVEIQELMFPILVEESGLDPNSAGAGRFRGGLGYRRVFRMVEPGSKVQINVERHGCVPWGLNGGGPAAPNRAYVQDKPGGEWELVLKRDDVPLGPETRVMICGGGGGGWGDPLQRDPAAVLRDVLEERISIEAAADLYGVVIAAEKVDSTGTAERRRLGSASDDNDRSDEK